MTQYRRAYVPGATWFFTVNLAERNGNRLLVEEVDALRAAIRAVQAAHSFRIDAAVILPDHLHCIWTLPRGDSDFSTRWALVKGAFSRSIRRENESHGAGQKEANGEYGNGVSGNISFGTKTTLGTTRTTFIGTRLSMAGCRRLWTGPIPAFMPIYDAVCMKRLGVERVFQILMLGNDKNPVGCGD